MIHPFWILLFGLWFALYCLIGMFMTIPISAITPERVTDTDWAFFVACILLWPLLLVVGALYAVCVVAAAYWREFTSGASILLIASIAHADPCHVVQKQRVLKQQVLVEVPTQVQAVQVFRSAIPTLVYNYNAAAKQYVNTQSIEEAENTVLLRQILATLQSQGGAAQAQAVDPLSLVRKSCNRCHSGQNAKAGFHTDGEMSNEDRMRAIEMILHDSPQKRMPKGAPLDPATMGKVIQQLSRRAESYSEPTTNELPPPPNPDDEPPRRTDE